jgi:hypothetical protein
MVIMSKMAFCDVYIPFTLEEMANRSDLIITAKVLSTQKIIKNNGDVYGITKLIITGMIKWKPSNYINQEIIVKCGSSD